MSTIPTDIINLCEINQHYVRQACVFYQERLDLGYKAEPARAQALAYLRRKTQWSEPIAAGALDYELTEREL